MSNTPVYWNRIGYVAIADDSGKMVKYGGTANEPYGGLDFKFSGSYFGTTFPVFSVSILGLSLETITRLTVLNPKDAMLKTRRVEVYAGYEKDGLSRPLMSGYIINAIPTNPPEMWLNMTCFGTDNTLFRPLDKAVRIYDRSVKALFEEKLAKEVGMEGKLAWKVRRTIPDSDENHVYAFTVEGVKADALRNFGEKFGVVVACLQDQVVAVDKYEQLFDPPSDIQTIDVEHGLIGMNEVTFAGCKIDRRLDTSVGYNYWVNLKSKIIPMASGKYRITKVTHKGHFRGKEWTTTLDGLRQGVAE